MASKQHSFKLDLENPTEKNINTFLSGKPTTFVMLEALKLYMRFEEAREQAIENAINAIAAPTPNLVTIPTPNKDARKDDLEDFDL